MNNACINGSVSSLRLPPYLAAEPHRVQRRGSRRVDHHWQLHPGDEAPSCFTLKQIAKLQTHAVDHRTIQSEVEDVGDISCTTFSWLLAHGCYWSTFLKITSTRRRLFGTSINVAFPVIAVLMSGAAFATELLDGRDLSIVLHAVFIFPDKKRVDHCCEWMTTQPQTDNSRDSGFLIALPTQRLACIRPQKLLVFIIEFVVYVVSRLLEQSRLRF